MLNLTSTRSKILPKIKSMYKISPNLNSFEKRLRREERIWKIVPTQIFAFSSLHNQKSWHINIDVTSSNLKTLIIIGQIGCGINYILVNYNHHNFKNSFISLVILYKNSMTNCSTGKSFDLHKTKRQGRTRTINETYTTINISNRLDSNNRRSTYLTNEPHKDSMVDASVPINGMKKIVSENEKTYRNVDRKLSSMKTQNWLKNLPINHHVSSFLLSFCASVNFSVMQFRFQKENPRWRKSKLWKRNRLRDLFSRI